MPKLGYLELGATKGGEDASLLLWQPTQEMWGERYDSAMKSIGQVTGVGFRTTNLDKTLESLKRRGVKVEGPGPEGTGRIASLYDPDGNVIFAYEPPKPKVRRPGLSALDFITIVSRDEKQAGEFLTKALGMRRRRLAREQMTEYRLSPRGTALLPFTPKKENYEDPADYDADMTHIGEETSIMFTTQDIYATQETLLSRGIRFKKKAEKAMWGGIEAEFFDPDDNVYSLVQPRE